VSNSSRTMNWLHYYRNSLADADRVSPRPGEDSVQLETLDQLEEHHWRKLLPKVTNNQGEEEQAPQGAIMIAPFCFKEQVDHGYKSSGRTLYPFWIPATITNTGDLLPPSDERLYPWFVRELLYPTSETTGSPTLGTIDDYDRAIERFDATGADWSDYYRLSEKLFYAVTGTLFVEAKLDQYIRIDQIIILKTEANFATRILIDTYDTFLNKQAELGGLGKTYLGAENSPSLKPIPRIEQIYLDSNHLGQMSNQFPLSDSQRYGIFLHLQTGPSEILAINGPPGTGKTTLLRSIVANLVVQKAVEAGPPPLLLASSTNNQAITNILENFATSETIDHPLAQSWVSPGGPVGVYMASGSKVEDYQGKAPVLTSSRGLFDGTYLSELDALSLSEEAETFFTRLSQAFPDQTQNLQTLEQASVFLHEQLVQEVEFLSRCVTAGLQLEPAFKNGGDPFEAVESYLNQQKNNLENAQQNNKAAQQLRDAYLTSDREVGGKFFARFLPSVKRNRFDEIRLRLDPFAPKDFFTNCTTLDQLSPAITTYLDQCRKAEIDAQLALTKTEIHIEPLRQLLQRFNQYNATGNPGADSITHRLKNEPWYMGFGDVLDVTVRFNAYLLAQRYWEARWLLALQERKEDFSRGAKGRSGFFTELAYLPPLFVCTCHSLPKFLSYSSPGPNKSWLSLPLVDLFDLVIMDEAGQVTPEIGLIPFLYGKRGLVVGDVNQIEPIWTITSDRVDGANLAQLGLISNHDDQQELKKAGVLACGGSAMAVAQSVSSYRYPEDMVVRGALLREHRRCVDEIIRYCDEFVYDKKLIPKTGDLVSYKEKRKAKGLPITSLPALGYVNIRGNCKRSSSGSRVNLLEAKAVVAFITFYMEELKQGYDGAKISDLIGIVTPFRGQANAIKNELISQGIDPDGEMVVGTVHSLQGSERPIVLFSPTYDLTDSGSRMFFDDGWNMLNVAVSRAKHHFIVIGEMGRFNPQRPDLPSGALGRLLFSEPEHEISPAFYFDTTSRFEDELSTKPSDVVRLDTLPKHQRALARAFERATKRIVIVSPFISYEALEQDQLEEKIRTATQQGVEVLVFTDGYLDTQFGRLKERSQRGRTILTESGATLIIKNGIHNKALAIDDDVLVEGSFNWLSATRDVTSPYYRREVSVVVQTDMTQRFIQDLLDFLEATPSVKG
jgi:RecA/RadA recombinase